MKRITDELPWLITYCLMLIAALGLGIYAGSHVTAAYKDTELMDLRAQVETANASLAEANIELAFWQNTMTHLANGEQFRGVDIKYGRPSVED